MHNCFWGLGLPRLENQNYCMTDPLFNEIHLTEAGLGIARFETRDVKDYLIQDIRKTVTQPACIYESSRESDTMYYFQYFKSTIFMCIIKKNENGYYLADTLFNPEKGLTEHILSRDKLIYSK